MERIYRLKNYVLGQWVPAQGAGEVLHHAINGEPVAICSSEGIDWAEVLAYGRKTGGPALRKMTFPERGRMLKALALHLYDHKELFYQLSTATGATRADSWIDIEGGIGNLFAYASLRRKFPDQPYFVEGEAARISRGGNFMGHHLMVPREGVAIHINAFNFPVWGMLEKVAVNWLAGVPALVKPAESSSFLTELVTRHIIDSGILPEGALQVVCGSGEGILEGVESQDVITFTGSASTGKRLKAHPRVIDQAVPFNMEADSLNAAVLGEDAVPGTPEFDLFVREVRKEMTVKCGQKCTAIRRILVPEAQIDRVQAALGQALDQVPYGDPAMEGVKMGALVSRDQVSEVRKRLAILEGAAERVYDQERNRPPLGGDPERGAFFAPVLLRTDSPWDSQAVHEVEAFGPVATLMPYRDLEEAMALTRLGKGSLCCSIVTFDRRIARDFVLGAAASHGRILVLDRECAQESTGHGSPLPLLVHGGPGRAGGGEEMGGMRGVMHYLQRTAIQGHPTALTHITGTYQEGGAQPRAEKHVFTKFFEDLVIGETVYTHKRTVTEADIIQFANVSWDHFYAHTDLTSLEDSPFEQRVAHGYFILSAAAGLFVDPAKGPVLLNYGLDDCRFLKPVYPGTTIGVKLTVKEKILQEKREEEPYEKGIVKFRMEVYDQDSDPVALATVLTMVKRKSTKA